MLLPSWHPGWVLLGSLLPLPAPFSAAVLGCALPGVLLAALGKGSWSCWGCVKDGGDLEQVDRGGCGCPSPITRDEIFLCPPVHEEGMGMENLS